jgi:capsid protein
VQFFSDEFFVRVKISFLQTLLGHFLNAFEMEKNSRHILPNESGQENIFFRTVQFNNSQREKKKASATSIANHLF